MPLFESSQLIAAYLFCQSTLKNTLSAPENLKTSNQKIVEQYCLPFLKSKTAPYVIESLISYAFFSKNKNLANKLYNFAAKNRQYISKRTYYEILTLKSFLKGQFLEASITAKKAFDLGSNNTHILLLVIFSSVSLNDAESFYKAVKELYEQGKNIEPLTDDFFKKKIFILDEKTVEVGKKLLTLLPKESYFVDFAKRLEQAGRLKDEEEILKEGLQLYPNSKDLQKLLINDYILTNRINEAKKIASKYQLEKYFYKAAVILSPSVSLTMKYADEVLKRYPNDKELIETVLFKYIFLKYSQGLEEVERILFSQKSKDIETLAILIAAKFAFEGHLNRQEMQFIENLYKNSPNVPEIRLLKALEDIQKKNLQEAQELLKTIKKSDYSNFSPYLKMLHDALYRFLFSTDFDELSSGAYSLYPIFAPIYLGILYHLDKKIYLDVAKRWASETIYPESCIGYTDIAWISGDLKTTLQIAKICLRRFKNNAFILNSVGYIMLLLNPTKYLEEAEKLLMEAHKLAPNNAAIYDSLGWLFYYKGEYLKALKWLKKSIEKEPNDMVVYYHIAVVLTHLNRPCEAKKYLRKAFELKGSYFLTPEPGLLPKLELLKKRLQKLCGSNKD